MCIVHSTLISKQDGYHSLVQEILSSNFFEVEYLDNPFCSIFLFFFIRKSFVSRILNRAEGIISARFNNV